MPLNGTFAVANETEACSNSVFQNSYYLVIFRLSRHLYIMMFSF